MIVVNPATRQFNIPGADLVFGVEADAGSERKYFQCPRYVGNKLDIAGSFVRINYRNANGEIDSYLVEDLTVDGDNVLFSWELSPKVTVYKGQIRFVMCAVGPDTKVAWHTTLGTGIVLEGLEPDYAMIQAGTADVVAQLIALVEAQTAAVEKTGADQVVVVKSAAKTAHDSAVAEIEAKRVNSLASIPADYTALSATVDTIARTVAPGIVCSAEGEVITLNDASDNYLSGLRIFGKSTQDGVPSPENPAEIVSIENPTINLGEQTLSIPRTLHGIPVDTGGNYTDANGQQWVCDEIDFARGAYVQRIGVVEYNANSIKAPEVGQTGIVGKNRWLLARDGKKTAESNLLTHLLCNVTLHGTADNTYVCKNGVANGISGAVYLYLDEISEMTAEQAFAWLKEKQVKVQYILATPIETPLSETELAAYRALHTNKPNTTILNDSGAYMSVDYTADTKLYIDNKLAALVGNT